MNRALSADLRRAVARRLGLDFPAERARDLEKAFVAAANSVGMPLAAFAGDFISGALGQPSFDALVDRLTIGETYFHRWPEANALLQSRILPELLHRRRDVRRLRIWSAACCTGEEPYTIAMLLRELVPDLAEWNVRILATDINPRFLRHAQEAVYGAWSFRAMPADMQHRYFHPLGDGRFLLDASVRDMVSFRRLNLCEEAYPSAANDLHAMDLILCRNVLMYFEETQVRRAVGRLHATLAEDGWLSVAACEASTTQFAPLTAVAFPEAVLYCRSSPQHAPRTPASQPLCDAAPRPRRVEARERIEAPAPEREILRLVAARSLDAALASCDRWRMQDKLNVVPRFLRALVALEAGAPSLAADSLRDCAYLAPDEPMVWYVAGNLAAAQGDAQQARSHYLRALELLARCLPDAPVALSDGWSAGELVGQLRELLDMTGSHEQAA